MLDKYFQTGAVHGRFQPFHNEHLEYCLEAKKHCNFLFIGITQFQIQDLKPSPNDKHRENKSDNPLTYFERSELIKYSLLDVGLTQNQFAIVPFPIDSPHLLPEFIPTNITLFTTINDSWNEHKINVLKEHGYEVIVLWKRQKAIIGSNIRELIFYNDENWKSLVPKPVVRYLEDLNIALRVKSLRSAE